MVAFQDFSTSLGSGEGHSDEVNMKNLVFRSNLPLASASEAGGMKLDLQSLNSTPLPPDNVTPSAAPHEIGFRAYLYG